jgi:hypothetical protein
MTASCLCENSHENSSRWAKALLPNNQQVFAYNMDCPEHGLGPPSYRLMRAVTKRAYLTIEQAWAASRMDDAKLIDKHTSGRMALIEWTEYEFYENDEQPIESKQ